MKDNTFKPGDLVVCVREGESIVLKNGNIYEIAGYTPLGNLSIKGYEHLGGYYQDRFRLATDTEILQKTFNWKEERWYIPIECESQFNAVVEFLKSVGYKFSTLAEPVQYDSEICGLVNHYLQTETVKPFLMYAKTPYDTLNEKVTIINVNGVTIPEKFEIQSFQLSTAHKQSEIEQIETEMRALADRLNKLKGEMK